MGFGTQKVKKQSSLKVSRSLTKDNFQLFIDRFMFILFIHASNGEYMGTGPFFVKVFVN